MRAWRPVVSQARYMRSCASWSAASARLPLNGARKASIARRSGSCGPGLGPVAVAARWRGFLACGMSGSLGVEGASRTCLRRTVAVDVFAGHRRGGAEVLRPPSIWRHAERRQPAITVVAVHRSDVRRQHLGTRAASRPPGAVAVLLAHGWERGLLDVGDKL